MSLFLALLVHPFNHLLAAPETSVFRTRAHENYQVAEASYQLNPTNVTQAWQFGKACFDLAEFAENDPIRRDLAERGIRVCRAAIQLAPSNAAANLYLAMNLGQLARTKSLGALKLVREMEALFLKAKTFDERLDFGGPDRCLGLLYLEAPGWPASVGNRKKALLHLRRAVELSPNYPGNRLELIAALIQLRQLSEAGRELSTLRSLWSSAQSDLQGSAWEGKWINWEVERRKLEAQLAGELTPSSARPEK